MPMSHAHRTRETRMPSEMGSAGLATTGAMTIGPTRPDPEVPEKPVRRRFTAEYTLRILTRRTRREIRARSAPCYAGKGCMPRPSQPGVASECRAPSTPCAPRSAVTQPTRGRHWHGGSPSWYGKTSILRTGSSKRKRSSRSQKKSPRCSVFL